MNSKAVQLYRKTLFHSKGRRRGDRRGRRAGEGGGGADEIISRSLISGQGTILSLI